MIGYKAFNENLRCRNFQYEIGSTYEFDGQPILCKQGFHFCRTIGQCYDFYPIDGKTRICKVEALGDIVENPDKCCTNKIRIIEEITDLQKVRVNADSSSTGYFNTGKNNEGHYNSGCGNPGSYNTGNYNTGDENTGWHNSGNNNVGDRNSGWGNTGDGNFGERNTGNFNLGYRNTGDNNIGERNTGDYNIGQYNTGNFNLGRFNSGDFNRGNNSTGCFNTKEEKIKLFDKPSNYTYDDWDSSEAHRIMYGLMADVFEVITHSDKDGWAKEYFEKEAEVVQLEREEAAQAQWDSLTREEQEVVKSLPNFDAEIFYQCTGIRVN